VKLSSSGGLTTIGFNAGAHDGPDWAGPGRRGKVIDDLFHLAVVDIEIAGYCSLAVACAVPLSYHLLQ
jgi:hypothetical protein